MALRITGPAISGRKMCHEEAVDDDINTFRKLKLSNPKYLMINYSIIFVCKKKIEKKTWRGKVRKNNTVQSHLHALYSIFA